MTIWPFKKKSRKLPWQKPGTQWKVGDLAVKTVEATINGEPPKGSVARVLEVFHGPTVSQKFKTVGLVLEGYPISQNRAWSALLFRRAQKDGLQETEKTSLKQLLGESA